MENEGIHSSIHPYIHSFIHSFIAVDRSNFAKLTWAALFNVYTGNICRRKTIYKIKSGQQFNRSIAWFNKWGNTIEKPTIELCKMYARSMQDVCKSFSYCLSGHVASHDRLNDLRRHRFQRPLIPPPPTVVVVFLVVGGGGIGGIRGRITLGILV